MLHVSDPWFGLISEGKKTIEGRVGPANKKYLQTALTNNVSSLSMKISHQQHYSTLGDFLDAHWQAAAPQATSRKHAEALYLLVIHTENGKVVDTFSPDRVAIEGGINALHLEMGKS